MGDVGEGVQAAPGKDASVQEQLPAGCQVPSQPVITTSKIFLLQAFLSFLKQPLHGETPASVPSHHKVLGTTSAKPQLMLLC